MNLDATPQQRLKSCITVMGATSLAVAAVAAPGATASSERAAQGASGVTA